MPLLRALLSAIVVDLSALVVSTYDYTYAREEDGFLELAEQVFLWPPSCRQASPLVYDQCADENIFGSMERPCHHLQPTRTGLSRKVRLRARNRR